MTVDANRARAVLPAGSNGEFNLPPELSIVIDRGAGCRLWDTSGREYLDFSLGWGSSLVGHARPEVVEAVTRRAARGSNFAYPAAQTVELAEELVRLSPACEQVRFCASGTEATMYCQRLARAATERPKILKFEGAYHGANEAGVTSLFPTNPRDFPQPQPTSAGIDAIAAASLLVAPYNDLETTSAIVARHAHELAGVIVEPLQRCTPPESGFLAGLRELTRAHDMLLIFDEVVTGFRLAYGGAQEYYGVVPDLVAYGKALGGGYPIGAFGGRHDLMTLVREERMGQAPYVWTASTLGGNPVSCSAALSALGVLRGDGVYPKLHELGRYLRARLARVLNESGVAAQILGDGPLAQVAFTPTPIRTYRDGLQADRALARRVMLALFADGIFLNPMGTKLYLSLAHTQADCDELVTKFRSALQREKEV